MRYSDGERYTQTAIAIPKRRSLYLNDDPLGQRSGALNLKKAGTMSGYKPEKTEKIKLVNATLLSMI